MARFGLVVCARCLASVASDGQNGQRTRYATRSSFGLALRSTDACATKATRIRPTHMLNAGGGRGRRQRWSAQGPAVRSERLCMHKQQRQRQRQWQWRQRHHRSAGVPTPSTWQHSLRWLVMRTAYKRRSEMVRAMQGGTLPEDG
ncbi:hypothetical protein THASP1DRAFT_21741 [Thamnocephalis sphaerospora]|uniref:Secreted protein n=1 Tax=Thamnocephalis sphaerospora TaxID=78915 RepID=A0A4P9XX47_9FUNG|nr:hypothetical protein THASP1DRAFT_21741 [Thamnocephalis sphaerospora]|eukprot:RKP10582.1 hypothetical protein THASP1DRAFT_21741 [Thamnocephalis sphaerospora]